MADRVVIELDLDASGAVTGGRRVEGVLDRVGHGSKSATGGLEKLGTALKGFLLAAAAQQLVGYTKRLFDLGTAAEETASKFGTVFGAAAARLDAARSEMANTMGLTQTEARGLAATVGAVAQGMGYGQEASADYAAQILSLAGDIVSFSNVEGGTEQVVRSLTSAMTGERESLKTLGIVISEADVKQKAASQTGKALTATFTQQEKAAATLALITERAGVAVGDLGRTQDSTANTARRLSAEVREQEQVFAQLLLPTFGLVLRELGGLIDENKGAGRSFAENLARGILYAVGAGVQITKTVKNVLQAIQGLGVSMGLFGGPGGPAQQFNNAVDASLTTLEEFAAGAIRIWRSINRLVYAGSAITRAQISYLRQQYAAMSIMERTTDEGQKIAASIRRLEATVNPVSERITAADDALRDLDRNSRARQRGGGFGAEMGQYQSQLTELIKGIDGAIAGAVAAASTVPEIQSALEGAAGAVEDGAARMKTAREKAATEAEQARRLGVDREFERRDLEIQAMQDDNKQVVAEIHLGADRRAEAFKRAYGTVTAAESAQLEAVRQAELRNALLDAKRREVEMSPEAASRGGAPALLTDPGQIAAVREAEATREAQRALEEQVRRTAGAMAEQGTVGLEVNSGLADSVAVLAARYAETANAVVGLMGSLSSALSDTYRRNVESETAALEAQGVAREDAVAQAEANNANLRKTEKRLASASVVYNTAAAIMKAIATLGPIAGPIAAIGIGVTGAAQLAAINAESPARSSGRSTSRGSTSDGSRSSSVAAGLAIGSGVAAPRPGSAQAPTVVNNFRPDIPQPTVIILADGQKLYATVEYGRKQTASGRGNTSGLQD